MITQDCWSVIDDIIGRHLGRHVSKLGQTSCLIKAAISRHVLGFTEAFSGLVEIASALFSEIGLHSKPPFCWHLPLRIVGIRL